MTTLRLGIAGTGIAALQVLPHLAALEGKVKLAALADVRRANMEFFCERYGRRVAMHDSVEAMCASPDVDAVWVASPNAQHAEHTIAAARHGKHVICEKPMAVSLDDCRAMVEAVERHGIKFVQGHSKAYDTPIRKMREILATGELGRVIHIQTWNWNDWLSRALVASEVDTGQGSGVVFRQGPHQTDIVRFLGGGKRAQRARGRRAAGIRTFRMARATTRRSSNSRTASRRRWCSTATAEFDMAELTWGIGESGKRMRNPDSRCREAGPAARSQRRRKYAMVRAGQLRTATAPAAAWMTPRRGAIPFSASRS